jgi:YHS domain-containing protein
MIVRRTIIVILLVAGLLFSGAAIAADAPGKGKPQTICPVLAGNIDKSVFTDYQGKRIYFCCSGCIDDFKKEPDKYMKQMEEQGITLEKSPDAK